MFLRLSFLILILSTSMASASGFRKWNRNPIPSKANWYIAARVGIGRMNADIENDIQSFTTDFCDYYQDNKSSGDLDAGEERGYGPCHNVEAGDLTSLRYIMKWDDWQASTPEMEKDVGFYAFAVGGYLPNHNKIRLELEWTQHNDFDYRDDRLYVGFPINPVDGDPISTLDTGMETQFKSTVSSSHVMFRIFYDFVEKSRKVGDWTPFVGAGIGLANNETTLTVIDPQQEILYDDGVTVSPLAPFIGQTETTISHQNFAWSLSLGMNYALSEHLSFDIGINHSNLGLIEWGFDSANTILKADELMATDIYLGFRFDF